MKKHLLNLIYILILCIASFFALYFYIFLQMKEKSENVSIQLKYLSSEMNREDYAIRTQNYLDVHKTDIQRIKSSIIPQGGEADFISSLESLVHQNNLTINIGSILFDNDKKFASTSIMVLKIKADIRGSWSNIYKFISEIEALQYKVKLNSVMMSKDSQESVQRDSKIIKTKSIWSTNLEIYVLEYMKT